MQKHLQDQNKQIETTPESGISWIWMVYKWNKMYVVMTVPANGNSRQKEGGEGMRLARVSVSDNRSAM